MGSQEIRVLMLMVCLGKLIFVKRILHATEKQNFSVAANGVCFRKDRLGFMPELMEKFYAERKHYKKLMIAAQKEKQTLMKSGALGADTRKLIEEKEYEIAKYHNFQLVRKIQLNSAYGAMGNQYFRYFNTDICRGDHDLGSVVDSIHRKQTE